MSFTSVVILNKYISVYILIKKKISSQTNEFNDSTLVVSRSTKILLRIKSIIIEHKFIFTKINFSMPIYLFIRLQL